MEIPKFLLGDNTNHQDAIFVIHTEYPRFLINLVDDEIEWWESFERTDEEALTVEVATLIEEASAFYDEEMKQYEKE